MIPPFLSGRPSEARSRTWIPLTPVAVACGAVGVLLGPSAERPSLEASPAALTGTDSDGDHLSDYQEEVLGTSPISADTDGDSWMDLEELARGTDPTDPWSFPVGLEASIGLIGRDEDGVTTISSLVFLPGGQLSGLRFEIGIVLGGVPIPLPGGAYMPSTCVEVVPLASGDVVVVVETSVASSLIVGLGNLALYSLVEDAAFAGNPVRADVLNLFEFSGVIMEAEPPEDSGSSAPTSWGSGGLVYRPLRSGEDLPTSFQSGELCFQVTDPIGITGVSIVQEVQGSACEPSESYCSPADCSAAVGRVIEIVDPVLLIGG